MKTNRTVTKTIDTQLGPVSFELVRSHRRTIAIQIKRDGSVAVRAPYYCTETDIIRFIGVRAGWILKHSTNSSKRHKSEEKSFTDGELHWYMGQQFPLRIITSEKNSISFSGSFFELRVSAGFSPETGRKMMDALYRKLSMAVFAGRLAALTEKFSAYSFQPAGLKVRTSKTRWGSCSANGSITLSSNLLKKRTDLIDYVIIHELCHLRHRNHGPDFYKLLGELCPDYKILRAGLK